MSYPERAETRRDIPEEAKPPTSINASTSILGTFAICNSNNAKTCSDLMLKRKSDQILATVARER
jgi:hypothetical protein